MIAARGGILEIIFILMGPGMILIGRVFLSSVRKDVMTREGAIPTTKFVPTEVLTAALV